MGASYTNHSALSSALFGKTRRAVLALLFTRPDETLYLREIVRALRGGQGGVQRELRRLAEARIIVRTVRGRTALYQANRACPVFGELQGLVVKTGGAADEMRAAAPAVAARAAIVKTRDASGRKPDAADDEGTGSTSARDAGDAHDRARRPRRDARAWLDRMPPELL
jgi:hypothetical protein